jgi:dTDP-4-dehydrorhamnose reductase
VKILLTGVSGQVGRALAVPLRALGEVIGAERKLLDLADSASIERAIRQFEPDLIINPAAYTAVDRAESEPDLAMRINAEGPATLAREAARTGARLVHFSTDYVFDGRKSGPYLESDPTAPASAYGRSKLAGELAIAASGCRHLVLRTSWVYDLTGANFLRTMFRLSSEREELRVVDDQVGAPTSSAAIAQGCAQAVQQWLLTDSSRDDGIYHMTCSGQTTWCGFARAIMVRLPQIAGALGVNPPARAPRVSGIKTQDYPTAAQRPANSVLDNSKLQTNFGVTMPPWEQALDSLIATGTKA